MHKHNVSAHNCLFVCMWVCVCVLVLPRVHQLRVICVCIGSIVAMCVLSLHSSVYFRGNDLTNRSTADLISGSFFLLLPWRIKCHGETSGGLVEAWVTAGRVRHYISNVHHTWVLQHTAYRSCETYFKEPSEVIHFPCLRWWTGNESCTHSLVWWLPLLIQGSVQWGYLRVPPPHTHLLLQMATINLLCIYRQWSITSILFWLIRCQ